MERFRTVGLKAGDKLRLDFWPADLHEMILAT